ncbi:MAG: hypothetical protein QXP96_06770 [Thermoproteota archaeon]
MLTELLKTLVEKVTLPHNTSSNNEVVKSLIEQDEYPKKLSKLTVKEKPQHLKYSFSHSRYDKKYSNSWNQSLGAIEAKAKAENRR